MRPLAGKQQASRTRPAPGPRARAHARRRSGVRPAGGRAVRATAGPPSHYRACKYTLPDGRVVTLRAIRPEDEPAIHRAFMVLSPRARYLRLMQHKRELDPLAVARGVRPLPGREFALVATVPSGDGYDIVGAARYVQAEDPVACEFAVTVADAWTCQGLATTILRRLMHRARRDGYARIEGVVLSYNHAMLALARYLHFEMLPQPGDATLVLVRKALRPGRA